MKREIAAGALWMLAYRIADRCLGIVSTLVLARLLTPADFGLVAMAMSVLAVIELATYFSFDTALIQRPTVERRHYDAAWTMNVLLASGGATATAALSVAVSKFYGDSRLIPIMLLLSCGWLLSGLENTGIAEFRRNLDFGREFGFMVTRRGAAFAMTMVLAFVFRSYWALVIGTVFSKLFGLILSYLLHSFRPRPSLGAARDLLSFSGWMVASNVANVVYSKVPHFIVGRVLGAGPLGLLTVASDIGQLPGTDLVAPVNRAVFPGYSRLSLNRERLRDTFLDISGVLIFVTTPAAIGIATVADPLVRLALGKQWLDAVPVLRILAIGTAVSAISSNNYPAYLALGQSRLFMLLSLLRAVVLVPLAVSLGRALGVVGVAYADLAAVSVGLASGIPVLLRSLGLSYREYFDRLWRPVVAGSIMAWGVGKLLDRMVKTSALDLIWSLIAGSLAGVLMFVSLVAVMWVVRGRPLGPEYIMISRLSAWWRGRNVPEGAA